MPANNKDYQREWHRKHPGKTSEYSRRSYLKHREQHIRLKLAQYRQRRDRIIADACATLGLSVTVEQYRQLVAIIAEMSRSEKT